MTEIIATLTFDSWIEDFPQLRATGAEDRHLIYEGGGLILDLLVKKDKQGGSIHIGGQVLPGDDLVASVGDVPVVLKQGSHHCQTHTNALGEFSFHSVADGNCVLSLTLENRKFVVHGLWDRNPRNWRVVPNVMSEGV